MHWCLNFVCEEEGSASAVLIRALEPAAGIAAMQRRRGLADERTLCSGPGKLCEALGVTHRHNGLPLDRPPFELRERRKSQKSLPAPASALPKRSTQPWRFGLKGSRFLSKPFRFNLTSPPPHQIVPRQILKSPVNNG